MFQSPRSLHPSPQPTRGVKPAPLSTQEDYEIEDPRAEDYYNAAKESKRRYASPVKGRGAAHARKLEDLFNNVKINDTLEDDNDTEKVLDLLHTASELVEAKAAKDGELQKSFSELPLLKVGDALDKDKVGLGFYVNECSNVCMDINGNVKITKGASASASNDNVKLVVMKFKSGVAWCYWTNEMVGNGSKTLSECLCDYGTGVMKTASGVLVKGVFLTKEMSTKPDKFFTLAVVTKNGNQSFVKQQEEDDSVFRIFRSCVPTQISDVINLHHLVNIRNQNQGTLFWEM